MEYISNTYILERDYGWLGVCVEASPEYFDKLVKNRKCTCVNCCVDEKPGKLEFILAGEVGGIIADDTDNSNINRSELIEKYRKE